MKRTLFATLVYPVKLLLKKVHKVSCHQGLLYGLLFLARNLLVFISKEKIKET